MIKELKEWAESAVEEAYTRKGFNRWYSRAQFYSLVCRGFITICFLIAGLILLAWRRL